MGALQTAPNKLFQYRSLVEDRKKCILCTGLGMTNPSRIEDGKYDSDQIGPWTQWQGDLGAELMIVGQDWGGSEYFIDQKGIEDDHNITNINLKRLLASIGYEVALPGEPAKPASLFFTNAVLCLKPGRLTGAVSPQCFQNCGVRFLKPQIEILQPKVVVTLGLMPYKAVMNAYKRCPRNSMRGAVQTTESIGSTTLVPVYHCGYYGTISRTIEEQTRDWSRAGSILGKAEYLSPAVK
jgi:uracil-DNA glycosylase family 4